MRLTQRILCVLKFQALDGDVPSGVLTDILLPPPAESLYTLPRKKPGSLIKLADQPANCQTGVLPYHLIFSKAEILKV